MTMKIFLILWFTLVSVNCKINRNRIPIQLHQRFRIKDNASTRPGNRIVGGQAADPHEYPWQVGIFLYYGNYFCGGSLISENYVLTAAHCVAGFSAASTDIVLGAINVRDENEKDQVIIKASKMIPHEEYSWFWLTNDIALIELSEPAPFSDAIQPVYLTIKDPVPGTTVTITGWGMTSDDGNSINDLSEKLMELDTNVVRKQVCAAVYLHPKNAWEQNLCLSGFGGKGSCNGDSGGPLVFFDGKNTVIGGVCSFGASSSCEAGYPSAYTSVHHYLDWIEYYTYVTPPS